MDVRMVDVEEGDAPCRVEPRSHVCCIRLNVIPKSGKPRSFESKFRKHCTKQLDGALRKSTLYTFKILFDSNSDFLDLRLRFSRMCVLLLFMLLY